MIYFGLKRKDYKNILDRRSSFLNWRYLKRPDDQYKLFLFIKKKLLGYFILKIL